MNNENNVYNNVNNNTGFNNTPVDNTNAMYNSTNNMYSQSTASTGNATYVNPNVSTQAPQVNTASSQVDHMNAVSNLNKEEAMEEALSHTNQYTPFQMPKQEVINTPKKENSKSAYILIAVIVIIMALFIVFLPQISKLLGW